jgi:hypothetical protein
MRIAVLTLAIGEEYKKVVKYGIRTKEEYCKRHGYALHSDEDIYVKERPIPWSKIKLIQRYMNPVEHYDFIVWIDADTLIMNPNIKLENIIREHFRPEVDFLTTRDNGACINTGVWFIRNTEYARRIIQDVWDDVESINSRYFEQTAFEKFWVSNHLNLKDFSVVLPADGQKEFNCSRMFYKHGMFICHFLGLSKLEWLSKSMNDICPIKMDEDTEEQYQRRMKWIVDTLK